MAEPSKEITAHDYEVEPALVAAAIIEKLRIVRRVRRQLALGESGRFQPEPARRPRHRDGRFEPRPAPLGSEGPGNETALAVPAHNA
jgi:hypothetical protein